MSKQSRTYVGQIKTQMHHNFLKLNSDKTELLIIRPKIDGHHITHSPTVRNRGVGGPLAYVCPGPIAFTDPRQI